MFHFEVYPFLFSIVVIVMILIVLVPYTAITLI
jgi:hypothetical protein